ncbi:MAG: methionyl-tRNA formyltransferase [Pseudohongiellaceae bacterium]
MNKPPNGLHIVFAGTPAFAAIHLATLQKSRHEVLGVITQPDKPGKRGKRPMPSPVKELADAEKLPLRQPSRINADIISEFSPDIMVVVAYGQLLRPEVLRVPPFGCINVHASLLPRWRGAAPIQRAILAGDSLSGISIMQMDEGLDTGDVFARHEVVIDPEDTAASLTDKLAHCGCGALIDVLDRLADGNVKALPQAREGVTYAPKVTKSEARIDWRDSADKIERSIRAFNPYPVAWCYLNGMRVKIWYAEAKHCHHEKPPGEIIAFTKEAIEVACGTGSLLLRHLQLPVGKGKVVTTSDLVNARKDEFTSGNRFF